MQPVSPLHRRLLAGALSVALSTLSLGSWAQESPKLEQAAVSGQWADVGSTVAGLAMGAAESNPLGLLTLGAKALARQQIQEAPPTEQPGLWSAYGAMGWGAAANNLCVIAAVVTGGGSAALCPLLGVATGIGNWHQDREAREQATFAAVCKQAQQQNPALICRYTPPST